MATIAPRPFRLRSGAQCTVRAGTVEDAPSLIEHQSHMIATDPNSLTEPGDKRRTLDEQRESIETALAEPGHLFLVAVEGPDGRTPLGALFFRAESRRKVRHHGFFGISVHSDWRGKGVGSALITSLLDWAAAHPHLEKICLGVFATNAGALRLYERLGFVQESISPRHFRLGPDRYIDDIWMAIYVKRGVAPEGFHTWRRRE